MRAFLERLALLIVVGLALGYGAGLGSARFAVSQAALLGLVSAVAALLLRRARTRRARAQMWATLTCAAWSLAAALVHADSLAYAGVVLGGAVFTVLNRPKRRPRRPELGPPGGVNRLSQPSSGDG
jgi:hypothetical protein